MVLPFNLRPKLFQGKLKLKWLRSFKVTYVFPSGVIELQNKDEKLFKVNGQWVKQYVGVPKEVKVLGWCILMKSE